MDEINYVVFSVITSYYQKSSVIKLICLYEWTYILMYPGILRSVSLLWFLNVMFVCSVLIYVTCTSMAIQHNNYKKMSFFIPSRQNLSGGAQHRTSCASPKHGIKIIHSSRMEIELLTMMFTATTPRRRYRWMYGWTNDFYYIYYFIYNQ